MMKLVRLSERLNPQMRYGAPLFLVGVVIGIAVDKPWGWAIFAVLAAPTILTCLVGAACAACISWGWFRCPTCRGRLTWDFERIRVAMREWSPLGPPPRTELVCEQCRRNVEFSEAGLTPRPVAEK
jgi:hypothetical protein